MQIWRCCFAPADSAVRLGVSCRSLLGTWGVSQLTFARGELNFTAHHPPPGLTVLLASISPPSPSGRRGTFEAPFPRSLAGLGHWHQQKQLV